MAGKPKSSSQGPPAPLLTYGCPVDTGFVRAKLGNNAQLFYDQYAFAHRTPIDMGAPPRRILFWNIAKTLIPGYFEQHAWTDRVVDTLCEQQWVGMAGCSGSAKTHNVTGFACLWWLCDPSESSVIFCSTTSKALRKRSWANVQTIHTTIPGPRQGNFVDSRMMWQATKGDDKHAIMGIAVEEGDTKKIADNIKGVHTKRQMVVITEATAVPAAIFEACTNLYSYPEEFILVLEANPRSWRDEFGRFVEPDNGILSVTVDMEEWETKPQINGRKGVCIRFDVKKSPNVDYPEDKPISKHLPSRARALGLNLSASYENSPSYWSNERGFPPPEGLNKNVFSEVGLRQCDAFGKHRFTGQHFEILAAFDPARTGDKPTLRFGALGEIEGGEMGLEVMSPITVPVNMEIQKTINHQIMDFLKQAFVKVNYRNSVTFCLPQNFGVDGTGGGADFCDTLNQGWSYSIMRVIFSAAASDEQCNHDDVRPASDVYRNKRAEMYFRARDLFNTGQIKGLDRATADEMATIEYDDSKKLIVIIDKKEYKLKYKKSPDDTDSLIILVEVARRKGLKLAAIGQSRVKFEDFEKEVTKANDVYLQIDYSPMNENFEPEHEEQTESPLWG